MMGSGCPRNTGANYCNIVGFLSKLPLQSYAGVLDNPHREYPLPLLLIERRLASTVLKERFG